ncbi:hypothetical protein ONB66_00755 [Candidatus Vidania fulgoroideae]|uniref:50S ribosomal protein L19 n=1 Tax=Candidatus Vidania fulgoroideorum TaxID=881286 RepID=A0AAX3NCA0_9PROT|nr:hypothetical protein ONB67_00140 [Candidatus Vidania fulgoroideae]WDR79372.1 hypothetical protein ONB66_00755 [Candidatus Vidania fulgoroideae]
MIKKGNNIKIEFIYEKKKQIISGKIILIKNKFILLTKFYKGKKIAEIKISKKNPNIKYSP